MFTKSNPSTCTDVTAAIGPLSAGSVQRASASVKHPRKVNGLLNCFLLILNYIPTIPRTTLNMTPKKTFAKHWLPSKTLNLIQEDFFSERALTAFFFLSDHVIFPTFDYKVYGKHEQREKETEYTIQHLEQGLHPWLLLWVHLFQQYYCLG